MTATSGATTAPALPEAPEGLQALPWRQPIDPELRRYLGELLCIAAAALPAESVTKALGFIVALAEEAVWGYCLAGAVPDADLDAVVPVLLALMPINDSTCTSCPPREGDGSIVDLLNRWLLTNLMHGPRYHSFVLSRECTGSIVLSVDCVCCPVGG